MTATLFEPTVVSPRAERADLLLSFDSAISHNDPAVQDDSNTTLFNRHKQLITVNQSAEPMPREVIERFCQVFPAPDTITDLLGQLSFEEFAATALLRVFADTYNSGEGSGLFSTMERWPRLEARAKISALQTNNLRAFWDALTRRMMVAVGSGATDRTLAAFWILPRDSAGGVLRVLSSNSNSIVSIARLWHDEQKRTSASYQEKRGEKADAVAVKTLSFEPGEPVADGPQVVTVEVPQVTSSTLRHVALREAGWLHMAGALGLRGGEPGTGELALATEALFMNGGNIAQGAKAPANPFTIATEIRRRYPLLDLVGGTVDSFDIGASKVRVNAWIVCKENREALRETEAYDSPMAFKSIFDMTDDESGTRQAVNGRGQMIRNFETLCKGVQVLTRFTLAPYTSQMTRGAFAAAVETFLENAPVVAGQGARGYGACSGQWLSKIEELAEARALYENYLNDKRAELREGLISGDLGTDKLLVS